MFLCSIDTHEPIYRSYTARSGVPLLSVDFRFAPEHRYPVSGQDCYAALRWATEHAAALDVDPGRIAIMGDSAGGGIAAAVTLMAHDRGGPALARQVLVYPMLDDRTTVADPAIEPCASWTTDDNITGWGCLLGAAAGGPDASPYAAPARAADVAGLPPAYIEMGQLDIFCAEDIRYAARLAAAGAEIELHVHPGVPHAFAAVHAGDPMVTHRPEVGRRPLGGRIARRPSSFEHVLRGAVAARRGARSPRCHGRSAALWWHSNLPARHRANPSLRVVTLGESRPSPVLSFDGTVSRAVTGVGDGPTERRTVVAARTGGTR